MNLQVNQKSSERWSLPCVWPEREFGNLQIEIRQNERDQIRSRLPPEPLASLSKYKQINRHLIIIPLNFVWLTKPTDDLSALLRVRV